MTDAITVGRRYGSFVVVGLDQYQKRVTVSCECGSDHVLGVDALLAGVNQCPSVNRIAVGHDPRR